MGRVRGLADGVVRWLTGHPRPLFGPPVLAEVTIIVDHDGRGHIFSPRFLDEDLATLSTVVAAMVRTSIWLAESRGLAWQGPSSEATP